MPTSSKSAPELIARNEPLSPDDEEMLVSRTIKFFMNIQLALIIFLALFWLYDHVWSGQVSNSPQILPDAFETYLY
jgi:hypothetical protein